MFDILETLNHLYFTLLITSSCYGVIFQFLPSHFISMEQMLMLMLPQIMKVCITGGLILLQYNFTFRQS